MLDDQAKWQLLSEMDRYHRQLRHIELLRNEAAEELAQHACGEHLRRVTDIYSQSGTRQQPTPPPPWHSTQLDRQ